MAVRSHLESLVDFAVFITPVRSNPTHEKQDKEDDQDDAADADAAAAVATAVLISENHTRT
jgi:hypothetical protein